MGRLNPPDRGPDDGGRVSPVSTVRPKSNADDLLQSRHLGYANDPVREPRPAPAIEDWTWVVARRCGLSRRDALHHNSARDISYDACTCANYRAGSDGQALQHGGSGADKDLFLQAALA